MLTIYQRIVCTEQVPIGASPLCARIVKVGVSDGGDYWEREMDVGVVMALIDQGWVFYTKGTRTGKVAIVQKYWCTNCRRYHIRSAPDCTVDNNLDYLAYCQWGKAA